MSRVKINDGLRKEERYQLRHPEWLRKNRIKCSARYYARLKDDFRNFFKTKNYCQYHQLPSPCLRIEEWKNHKVLRVSRKANGRFIKTKEV